MRVRVRQQAYDVNHRGRCVRDQRLPLKRRGMNPALWLGALAVLLLIGAGVVYLSIRHEGDGARKSAQDLLNQYDRAVSAAHSSMPAPAPVAAQTQPEASQAAPAASQLLPGDGYEQPDAPDVDPKDALISLPGHDVIGKLRIDAIGVELPVIAKVTTKALRVSVCWYGGAMPGEKGNMIVTGHNYANGAHFGKLDRLKTGDAVVFDAPGGKVYRYAVYESQVVKPDDVAALNKTQGDYALTLVTCASSGNRRLIVRCRLASAG